MTRAAIGALALVVMLTTGACGTTYVDTEVTVAPTAPIVTTTLAPIADDAPLEQVLGEIELLMQHLDEAIVDDAAPAGTLAWLAIHAGCPSMTPARL